MKTLLLTRDFPPRGGGMARLYGELCRHFPPGTVEVVTVSDPAGAAYDAASAAPIHRLSFDFRRSRTLAAVARWWSWTRRRLRRGDVAVLQIGNIRPTGYVGWLLRRRVPYVVYVHGLDLRKEERRLHGARNRRITRAVLGGAGAVIANSTPVAELARSVMRAAGASPDTVRVVHPGTDPERFRADPAGAAEWQSELALGDAPVLLSVARLVPRKGIDVVLRALPLVRARHPTVRYLIAGTGPDEARLRALAVQLGVSDCVRFVGAVSDERLPGLYSAADLFVLPAREEREHDEIEGFGIVYCEAAAAGVPSVAGDSGGVRDAVRDGETGLLVDPLNPAAVAAAIGMLLGDAPMRRAMGAAARHAVVTYYNWQRAADEAWRIIEGVRAQHAGDAP